MATKEEEAIMKDLNLQFRGIRAAPRNSEKAASLVSLASFVRSLHILTTL